MTAQKIPLSHNAYHAMDALSNSRISDYLKSPAYYHGRHIAKTIPAPKQSASMEWGTKVHRFLLDQDFVAEIPADFNRRGGKNTNGYRDWAAQNREKIICTPEEHEALLQIEANTHNHKMADKLIFGEGESEVSLLWKSLGVDCKARLDRVLPIGGSLFVVDIKTTSDPSAEAFAKSAFRYGYHRQSSFYQEGALAFYDPDGLIDGNIHFVFVAIRNSPPWDVECYELSADFENIGADEWVNALKEIRGRMETGDWKSKTHGSVVTLAPPRYAEYASEWEVESDGD